MQEPQEKAPTERQIRETLEQFEVPLDPNSWALLEQKLNAPFSEEIPEAVAEVDKIVYPKIARFEADFNSKHWAIMADRLRLIEFRKRQVWSSKLIETAIFLLLLINLPAWLGLAPEPKKRILIPRNQAVAALEQPSDRHQKSQKSLAPSALATDETGRSANAFLQNFGIDAARAEGLLNSAALLLPFSPEAVFDAQNAFFAADFFDPKAAEKAAETVAPPLAFSTQSVDNEAVMIEKELARPTLFPKIQTRETESIATTEKPFLPISFVAEKTQKRRWRLAAFASPQVNYVVTPARKADRLEQFEQLAAGYGGGISVGSQTGRWGVETGAVYQAKKYVRNSVLVTGVFGSYKSQEIRRVEFEELAVPVHLVCQVGRLKKLKISAIGGSSIAIVAQKNVVRRSTTDDPDGLLAKAARLDAQKNSGLFEGGRFEKNAFITADLGLRLERHLGGSRYSFFIEPTVQKTLGSRGFGPNGDRITSLVLRAGLSSTL